MQSTLFLFCNGLGHSKRWKWRTAPRITCRPTVGQLLANTLPTHYRQSTNRSPTVGRQIPYSGEIVISVLAFNRYNLVNVAHDRSQNSWLKMMETTHCYNLTEWSSFNERCLQNWSHKLEKSLHVLQFPLEYLLKGKTNVFEANYAL